MKQFIHRNLGWIIPLGICAMLVAATVIVSHSADAALHRKRELLQPTYVKIVEASAARSTGRLYAEQAEKRKAKGELVAAKKKFDAADREFARAQEIEDEVFITKTLANDQFHRYLDLQLAMNILLMLSTVAAGVTLSRLVRAANQRRKEIADDI